MVEELEFRRWWPSSVEAPLPSPSTKKTVPKLMRDDRADRLAIDDRDHARPLVLPQQRIVVRRADRQSKS